MSLSVSTTIHPADHMWNSGPAWYYSVGQSGLDVVRAVLSLSRCATVHSILDLPSGHGRVARYLRAAFPQAEMTFCDLDASGAEFCAQEFGGTVLPSKPELSDVDFKQQYNVIWVGSLFTHVDRSRTERWLRHLCQALAPDGVLVATFHGFWSAEVQKMHPMIEASLWSKIVADRDANGYGYSPYPDSTDYGISLSRPSVIVNMIEETPGVRLLSYTERAWADNHDVLGVAKTDRLQPW